jgi:PBSX family phage terminase large subunit
MKLTIPQAQIASDTHRFRVVNCGRRFGKTTLAVEEIKGKAVYTEARIAYIAPTYQQARDIAWQMLLKELQPIIVKQNESRLELEVRNLKKTISLIQLRGWESVETARGQKFDMLVIDEVASMRNFWSSWEEVLRPTLTDTRGSVIFISTPKGFNHFYDLYNLENEDRDYKSFHFTSYDNPYLPKEELDKSKEELTEDRFAQEYLADFRKTEGLVYKEFNRDKHLFDEPGFDGEVLQIVKTFGGHDFGTHNPCASITIKKDKDNNYWVTDEWYKTGKTDAEQADYVAALKWNECYADPESLSGIEEMKRRGVNVRDVIKNKDSIKNGINTVRELFKQGRLYISSGCKNLIWELETYSYPDKKDMHNEEENPIKENDHACDALRYALSMEMIDKKDSINIYHPQGIGLLTQKQNFSVNRPSSGFNKFR